MRKITPSTRLGPEEDLLAAVVASRWNPNRLDEIPALAERTTAEDWHRAVAFHGLAGVLTRYHEAAQALLPEDFTRATAEVYAGHAPRALRQFQTLAHIHRILDDAGVPHLPLKGLFLSLRLYGDISVRTSSDIDVLIDPADFDAAYEALTAAGFRSEVDYQGQAWMRDLMFRSTHHVSMCSRDGQHLELHWRNDPSPWHSLAPLREISSRLEEARHGPLTFSTLPGRWLRETLALHAAYCSSFRWKWGYDVLHIASVSDPATPPWERIAAFDLDWFERVCSGVMAKQLGESLPPLPRKLSAAIDVSSKHGVDLRILRSSQDDHRTFAQELETRWVTYRAAWARETSLTNRLRWVWRWMTTCNPATEGRSARLVARAPALALFVRLPRMVVRHVRKPRPRWTPTARKADG